jgi:hypothetical protein
MSLLLQDVIVTLFSVGAAAMVAQRVFGVFRPQRTKTPCATCTTCTPSPTPPRHE